MKDLIEIIYADGERVESESKLLSEINKTLKIDENIIKYLYFLQEGKKKDEFLTYLENRNFDKDLINTLIIT